MGEDFTEYDADIFGITLMQRARDANMKCVFETDTAKQVVRFRFIDVRATDRFAFGRVANGKSKHLVSSINRDGSFDSLTTCGKPVARIYSLSLEDATPPCTTCFSWGVDYFQEQNETYARRGKCPTCDSPLPPSSGRGSQRKFCSSACRQKRYRQKRQTSEGHRTSGSR
jgi:hypothetical protein